MRADHGEAVSGSHLCGLLLGRHIDPNCVWCLFLLLLLQQPKVVTWSFFQTDYIPAAWIVCW